MQETTDRVWTSEPFRDGTVDEYARLRAMLVRNGYTAEMICERLGLGSMSEFTQFRQGRERMRDMTDPLSLLVRLFFDLEKVPWATVRSFLPTLDIEAIEALGLIRTAHSDETLCFATVLLYPVEGLYIASDRNFDAEGSVALPEDVVYAAVTKNTYQFMAALPRSPCDRFLELCAGTGIAALVAARDFAGQAVASDITERATRFARFNARLNAQENVEAVQGDLYAPVRGRTFDRIVAHPPYVPAIEAKYVYRDAGEDGEQITRRIIEGLPEFLAPGGRFYCLCSMTDRRGAPLEQRIRGMLGAKADEFDVVVTRGRYTSAAQFVFERARDGLGPGETLASRIKGFERLEIEGLVYGVIVVQRRAHPRPVFTTRRNLSIGDGTRFVEAAEIDWVLRWEESALDPALPARLLDQAPRANPALQLRQLAHFGEDGWQLEQTWVDVLAPVSVQAECPPWVPALLVDANGRLSGREHLARLKQRGLAPEQATEEEFGLLLFRFMSAAMIDTAECPLPRPAAGGGPRRQGQDPPTS